MPELQIIFVVVRAENVRVLGCAHAGLSVLSNQGDGHIAAAAVERNCPNDDEALKEARQLVNGHDIEVWQSTRKVAYLTPDDK
ncbi:MAG TPA: hypothetical protein VIJ52_07635 [Pseudolabrys sp.]